ncbi:MAG TPA: helix-turn-helix transcriptional regulator [Acidimicrobiales bacterium]|nr:helix-turn-helix transcriptional regulator [Acidimicrobiales bacterium]
MAPRSRLKAQREGLRPYLSQDQMARKIGVDRKTVWRWEVGEADPYDRHLPLIAEHYDWPLDRIPELLARDDEPAVGASEPATSVPDVDGIGAIELIRRTEATDVGSGTVSAIVHAVERLATSYTHMVPAELLASLRTYQSYVMRLLDGRATLAQRRELTRQAGWLSLLVATAAIDVGQDRAAAANFDAARVMARESGDDQLAAWVFETEAWQALSTGRFDRAAALCRAGLDLVGSNTSAHVQLCTQAARAAARLGDRRETRRRVDQAMTEIDRLPSAVGPEHHFTADRDRVLLHCAAALVWLADGDATTEEYARRSVDTYEPGDYAHHLATARMNLAILLADTDQPAEAAHLGQQAIIEAAWRLCRTDLLLTDDLNRTLTGRYDASEVQFWTEAYTETRRAIMTRQPELTASTSTPPAIG